MQKNLSSSTILTALARNFYQKRKISIFTTNPNGFIFALKFPYHNRVLIGCSSDAHRMLEQPQLKPNL